MQWPIERKSLPAKLWPDKRFSKEFWVRSTILFETLFAAREPGLPDGLVSNKKNSRFG
jgi:hypothetical protein